MGRIILVDDNVQAYVEKLIRTDTWYLGLLIGKVINLLDIVMFYVEMSV